MSEPVFVNHAHVFPPDINPQATPPRLIQLLDACAIDEAVCFAPFPYQCDNKGIEPNEWLAGELPKYAGRLRGFGTIDFRLDDVHDQVRRIKNLGLVGLKLHPNSQRFSILSERAFEVYAAASELRMFITFHTGVHASRLADTRVIDFDEVGLRFPELKFSMEHVGGYHFFNEALAVLFNHVPPPWETGKSNVFAGLASVFTTHVNRFWHLSRERLLELVAQIGAEQCIFGLDFPYNLERETMIGLETIRGMGLSETETAGILGGNLRRQLQLLADG